MPDPVTHYVVLVTADSGWDNVLGAYPVTVQRRTRKHNVIKQALKNAGVKFDGTVWGRAIERDAASPLDVLFRGRDVHGAAVLIEEES